MRRPARYGRVHGRLRRLALASQVGLLSRAGPGQAGRMAGAGRVSGLVTEGIVVGCGGKADIDRCIGVVRRRIAIAGKGNHLVGGDKEIRHVVDLRPTVGCSNLSCWT